MALLQIKVKLVCVSLCQIVLDEDLHASQGLSCIFETVEPAESSEGGLGVLKQREGLIRK